MFGGKQLAAAGVLGLNRRNTDFIMRLNPRRLYPRVDDKLITKALALDAGMAVLAAMSYFHNKNLQNVDRILRIVIKD